MVIHQNIYFTGKTTATVGPFRNRPVLGLESAVRKMGGTVVTNLDMADNIIVGWYADYNAIEKQYPDAMLMLEAKIDDFVQELEIGIEQLY